MEKGKIRYNGHNENGDAEVEQLNRNFNNNSNGYHPKEKSTEKRIFDDR